MAKSTDALTVDQRRHYEEQGFVILRDLFARSELEPMIREIEATVDCIARDHHARGHLRSLHEDHGFTTRFIALCQEWPDVYKELTVGSPLLGPEMFNLLRHPQILDVVESIVGLEVQCEGRHNLRPKLPSLDLADFRWHEDTLFEARRVIYVEEQYGLGPDNAQRQGRILSRIVAAPQMPEPGFWIPLVDVDEQNGCLQVLPGGHRHTAADKAHFDPSRYVAQLEGLTPLAAPMHVGDVLLMHQHLPHVSPPNRSDHIRWSIDIRYQDGRHPAQSARKPGFLARSQARPDDVVTTYTEYLRIREAADAFARTPGIQIS